MDMVTIGTILKKRIREKGYTQEEFCEKWELAYQA